ncbi:MAG: preprotein translocase subunit SecG [Candidatus Omnitrophica bacterium]|nr:preprotein translocase subunit SecG [Candidatus Omnitrophota bacterium]
MTGLIIALHVIICILLIIIILIQAGRGGGLVESFSQVESIFGTRTNSFLTRTTTTLAILFFITCILLALISARQSRSLMRNLRPQAEPAEATTNIPSSSNSPDASQVQR